MSSNDLLGRYRRAFVAGDLESLVELFAFPVQSIGVDADGGTVVAMERDRWAGVLESILAAYRSLGVRDATILEQETWEPLPGAHHVRVHWALQRNDGSAVYDFTAIYTVVGAAGRHRIVAVLHDEALKLRTALGALPG